jgi:soluble lytic murein transglycosylase-like protein
MSNPNLYFDSFVPTLNYIKDIQTKKRINGAEKKDGSSSDNKEVIVNDKFQSKICTKDNNSYNDLILKYAEKYDINPNLLKAVIKQESYFKPNAKSHCGAMGLMQLMPATARGLKVSNPWDPEQNINGGAKLLSQLLTRYNGRVDLALAAYNAGPGRVKNSVPNIKETQNYVKRITAYYKEYNEAIA